MTEDVANSLDALEDEPGLQPALGERAARGFVYQLAQIGGMKLVNVVGQYILSWLLVSRDFGHISEAYVVAGFVALLGHGGIREMLIRRWKRLDRYATSAFWMAMTLGVLSTLVMMAAAPLAARFFKDPELTPLILILGCQNIFLSLQAVPDARLSIDLRYRMIAAINFISSAMLMVGSVIFAALGFGAYSFIIPWPIMAAVRAGLLWAAARQRVGWRPQVKLWRDMWGDNGMILLAAFFLTITWQCDYMILGRMYPQDKEIVGRYFWAFNLSTQTLHVLALNVAAILLPSLAKLQDEPGRLLSAFSRAGQALMILAAPACLLQAAAAGPFIRFAFRSEWFGAIPVVQILSVGWMLFAVRFSADSLLKAEGRFRRYLYFTVFSAALFLVCVYIGAKLGKASGAAAGVGVYSSIAGPLSVYIATRGLGGTWGNTMRIFAAPAAAAAAATIPAWAAGRALAKALPEARSSYAIETLVIVALCAAIYIPIIRLLSREAFDDLVGRLRRLVGLGAPAATAEPA